MADNSTQSDGDPKDVGVNLRPDSDSDVLSELSDCEPQPRSSFSPKSKVQPLREGLVARDDPQVLFVDVDKTASFALRTESFGDDALVTAEYRPGVPWQALYETDFANCWRTPCVQTPEAMWAEGVEAIRYGPATPPPPR